MIIRQVVLLFLTIVSTQLVNAQNEYNKFKQIDELLYDQINKKFINGAVVLVLKNNKPIHKKAYGFRNPSKDSLNFNDIFRMASQTKAITTVVAMQLIEEDKIHFDDPIEKYIPSFNNLKVINSYNVNDTTYTTIPSKRSIKIFDLLTHTSGIGYPVIGTEEAVAIYEKNKIPSGVASNNDTLEVIINKLGNLPIFHHPGESWTYGINLEVLGYIIEIVEGENLEKVFQKRVFKPLEMNDTYFTLPEDYQNRLVTIYTTLPNQYTQPLSIGIPDIGSLISEYPKLPNTFLAGGAGLSGSIEDYGKFLSMLLNKGIWNNKRILSEASVVKMTTHQIGDISFNGEFGLGFQINGENKRFNPYMSIGAYQWSGVFGTSYWVDPKENLIVLLYTNVWPRDYPDFTNKFQNLLYQAIKY